MAVFPDDRCDEYVKILADVMVASAERFTMPYGVRVEVGPAVGQAWLKD